MDNVIETQIILKDGVTAPLAAVGQSVAKLEGNMTEMNSAFTRPLEHMGVHMFGMELLNVIGISEGARPALMVLQVAISQLGNAFGILSGGTGLAIMGLVALGAVIMRVVQSHNKHTESLVEVLDANIKTTDAMKSAVSTCDEYDKVLKEHLTPSMKAYEAAVRSASAASMSKDIKSTQDILESNAKTIKDLTEENKEYGEEIKNQDVALVTRTRNLQDTDVQSKFVASDTKDLTKYISSNKEAIDKLNESNAKNNALLIALRAGYTSVEVYQKAQIKNTLEAVSAKEKESKASGIMLAALEQEKSKLAQYVNEEKMLTSGLFAAKIAAVNAWAEKESAAESKQYGQELARLNQHGKLTTAAQTKLDADLKMLASQSQEVITQISVTADAKRDAATREFVGLQANAAQDWDLIWQGAATNIENSSSTAFAKMIVEHKSFAAETKAIWKDLAEQIIMEMVRMEEKALIITPLFKFLGIIATVP